MFYTRIPVPSNSQHSAQILNQSRKYFPAVGCLIGAIGAITYAFSMPLFSPLLSVALSMLATIIATGAFHEDGLADSCDGLGGGWHTDQVLTIMKDSRIGTYGTIGLIAALGIKYLALLELASHAQIALVALVLITAHSLSRQLASSTIERCTYVQDIDQSKVKPVTDRHLSSAAINVSLISTGIPLLILTIIEPFAAITAALSAGIASLWFTRYCNQRIGGYTGDTLGATQQLSELSFYLVFIACLS
ncbi:cobalamin-5'-phosphate synthase [Arenicella xantha]|uniref:Adenosylcobinamide-GDP ribazoletransferase n=2 Tax=Arenicella xantha TaxID=644221 RepID=A0A395JLH7_9GAMM|nr:cobalamin-5'-phosphate synthase [Arenicella xantha]